MKLIVVVAAVAFVVLCSCFLLAVNVKKKKNAVVEYLSVYLYIRD